MKTWKAMELFVKIVILCVIFTYVFADEQDYYPEAIYQTKIWRHINVPQKPLNMTEVLQKRAERLKTSMANCSEETKVSLDAVLKLKTGEWVPSPWEESEPLKEWTLCLFVKFGMMSVDGVLKQHTVLAYVPEEDKEKVEKVIDECLYKQAHKPTDTAWHYFTCFRSKLLKYSVI